MTIQQAFELALHHHQAGRLAEAEAIYRQVLTADPRHADALHLLGVIAHQLGRNDVAVALIRQAISTKPDFPEAFSNLGIALRGTGQLDEAIAACRRAIAFKPDFPEAHSNLGIALHDIGHLDEAIAACREAIALTPDYPEAHTNLGNSLRSKGRLDEAISACHQAIALKPDVPEAHHNLGNALYDQGRLDEAIAAYCKAIAIRPRYAEAHTNLGIALQGRGQLDESIAACRQAVALKPGHPESHENLALALLQRGDYPEGWAEYEWRWKCRSIRPTRRDFNKPQWDGSPLEGRTILLHDEQGFGDTLQFIRYAPLVAKLGGRVLVECQPGLETLLADVEGIAQVFSRGGPWPAFDLHCPLMSLPLAFGTRVETIPCTIPYLRADTRKAARWRERLDRESASPGKPCQPRRDRLHVGLVWAGGARPHQPSAAAVDGRRSMRLSQFAPLAGLGGVVFVSLQKGGPAEQAGTPPQGMRLVDWTAELHDFSDTAALIDCLDLVIGVDTSVAHLAGALGKPVWVLNRFDNCWRWLLDRTDSPWYPTMRLFRQPRPGDWEPVIAEVRKELDLLVKSQGGTGDQAKGEV